MPLRWIRQSTLPVKSVRNAPCIWVKLVLLLEVALYLLASKWLVQVGALHTLRRLYGVLASTFLKKDRYAVFFVASPVSI